MNAAKGSPLAPVAPESLARFGELSAVEQEAREGRLRPAARLALRPAKRVPRMAELKARRGEVRQPIQPGGKRAQACDSALGQWRRWEADLKDGAWAVDHNWCEGALRPLALGGQNGLHVGRPAAGPKIAALASLVETGRRWDSNLRA